MLNSSMGCFDQKDEQETPELTYCHQDLFADFGHDAYRPVASEVVMFLCTFQ